MTRCHHLLPRPAGPAASPALRRSPVLRDLKNRPQNPTDPHTLRRQPPSAPCAAGRRGVSPQPARPEGTVTRARGERARREPPAGTGTGQWEGTRTRAQGPGAPGPGAALSAPSARPHRGSRSASRRPLSAHSDPARAASSPHPAPGRYWPRPPPVSSSPPPIGRLPPLGGRTGHFRIRHGAPRSVICEAEAPSPPTGSDQW